ncbi:hypothetical protein [Streptomyces sp. NPDC056401]|uniref:hypothetical protein n=1 Tax=Streptomyces sp. NPDC056401 TaxID=3345809 RepID=UPI0035E390CC
MDGQELEDARRQMSELAAQEGFALADVFVEREWLHSTALDGLVAYARRHQVRHVVVPSTPHLHTVPSLAFIAQVVMQEAVGGLVWVAQVTQEETASVRALLDARPL